MLNDLTGIYKILIIEPWVGGKMLTLVFVEKLVFLEERLLYLIGLAANFANFHIADDCL